MAAIADAKWMRTGLLAALVTGLAVAATGPNAEAVRRVPRLVVTQALARTVDHNQNLLLDAAYSTTSLLTSTRRQVPADSYSFTWTVTNTGAVTVSALRVVNARFAKALSSGACAAASLSPGQSTTCSSAMVDVTPYVAENGIGDVYTHITGTSSTGKRVVSNTAQSSYGRLTLLGLQIETAVQAVARLGCAAARRAMP